MRRLCRYTLIVFAALSGLACSSTPNSVAFMRVRQDASAERKVIRSGSLTVSVATPSDSMSEVQRLVEESGGFVEWSNVAKDEHIALRTRVPEPQLDRIMDAIAALGTEESRSVSAADVTEQHSDLSTRLKNNIALRDRLRALLERATDVEDVLAIEKELTRIQSEVETLQAGLDRLDSQIALSELSITLQRKQILGPLGYIGYGVWWAISKLLVIR